MRNCGAGTALLLASIALAACSGFGKPKPAEVVDPNALPANYRNQIATFLLTQLIDRADYTGAMISMPTLKPVGDSQRYVVCLQFNGRGVRKDKVVIYFAGAIQQFVTPKPEQCGDAVYQPFKELADEIPEK
ncbi:MAG TPA: hypothetical protein VMJ52_06955 [Xanthobacteraceae bacterium]|nr:hypothetical protein [Xanthobacteraceae bacterium]